MWYLVLKCKFRFRGIKQAGRLSDLSIEYMIFLNRKFSNGGHQRNEIWHKGGLGGEYGARTLITRIAQRKRAIPQLTMKNNLNMMYVLVTVLSNQPKACASDLGDEQSRYLLVIRGILTKLPISIHLVSGKNWNGLQAQRWKFGMWQRHTFWPYDIVSPYLGLPVQHRLAGQAYIFCCCTFVFLFYCHLNLYTRIGPSSAHRYYKNSVAAGDADKISTDIRPMMPPF